MANFAQIDENNIVLNVIVVPDEQANRGLDYISGDLGLDGLWVASTSNDPEDVKFYANLGDLYNPEDGSFKPEPIYAGWVWNATTWEWESPTPVPENLNPGNLKEIYWDTVNFTWGVRDYPPRRTY